MDWPAMTIWPETLSGAGACCRGWAGSREQAQSRTPSKQANFVKPARTIISSGAKAPRFLFAFAARLKSCPFKASNLFTARKAGTLHSKLHPSSSQFTWTAKSISQRLAGFQGEGDALLRFWLAAEGEEGFALEVEDVLLADQGSRRDAAAGENVGRPAGYFLVVLGCVAGLTHEKDTGLEGGQGRCAGRGNLRARLRSRVACRGQCCCLGLGVEEQPLAVEGNAVGGRKQAERARFGGRGGDLGQGDGFKGATERRGQLRRLSKARRSDERR